jgi:hypothetical protein
VIPVEAVEAMMSHLDYNSLRGVSPDAILRCLQECERILGVTK